MTRFSETGTVAVVIGSSPGEIREAEPGALPATSDEATASILGSKVTLGALAARLGTGRQVTGLIRRFPTGDRSC